jgi:phosphate ABC transporter permease subunit PstA
LEAINVKIRPSLIIAFTASSIMFLSSLICLILQPDLSAITPLWEAALTISVFMIALSALSERVWRFGLRSIAFLFIDQVLILAIFLLTFTQAIGPGYEIANPLGLGASFSYNLILSILVFLSSLLVAKDSINIHYHYSNKGRQALAFFAIRLSAVLALLILGGILFVIIYNGMGALSWEFLTQPPRSLGQAGGISTAILGSLWMVLGAMIVSAPLGIGAAIYLHEYSTNVKLNRSVTIAVSCLNGVPSVVFGLFGLAFLVTYFGISLLSGSIILGLINIPTIILTSQEALKSVPNSLREGSMALGATKWQTVRKIVLPSAMPGILTGLIIGVAKASGETAPIMWTAVTFTATPVQMIYGVIPNLFQPVNNLDYHLLNLIYFMGGWDVEKNAWGTALVLLILVLSTNMLAILVRNYYRKKISW